jgi:hypothetical protein
MNVNNQLGIPVMSHEYDNYTHIDNYANAGGRGKAKVKNFFNKAFSLTPVGMVAKGIKNADTQRVTSADRDAAEQWVMNSFGNQLLEAKTLDQIDYWAGVMADQKVDMEMMLGKRKSGVGNVLSFGRQYKRRGKNAGLCTNDGCIRQSQARLDALNQFEVRHNTAITTLRKKLEKQMEEKPPVSGGTTTGGSGEQGQILQQGRADTALAGGITTTSGAGATDDTKPKDMNKYIMYGIGGLLGVGVLIALLKK